MTRSVRVTGHPGSNDFTYHPNFQVKVQVNDAQCPHVNAKRTPLRIAVEVDGKRFHYDSKRQIERDTERHNGLTASGIVSLRCNAWESNETERSGKLEVGTIMLGRLMEIASREIVGPGVQVDSGDRAPRQA